MTLANAETGSIKPISEIEEPAPLVIVEGFMSDAGAMLWGNVQEHSNFVGRLDEKKERMTIFAGVGPVSSLHDRACEVFYALVGGTVDYREEHSRQNGHGRYGRTHNSGLYSQWSPKKPLHFLGHSSGGPTIMKLQWLLTTGFFGDDYHPDMVLSVTTVSSPFRGSQLVYTMGEHTDGAPAVRPFSLGSALAKCIHLASYLSPLIGGAVDLHTEARALSYEDASFVSLVKQLWRSDWAESRDATPFDVTFEAADEREDKREGAIDPRTYYRSYAASMAERKGETSSSSLLPTLHSIIAATVFYLPSKAMESFNFWGLRPRPSFSSSVRPGRPEATVQAIPPTFPGSRSGSTVYRANDGVVPLFSQWHPFQCSATRCKHFSAVDNTDPAALDTDKYEEEGKPESGIWHVHHVDGAHHLTFVPLWLGTARQKLFWRDVGLWLSAIDRETEVARQV